MSIICSICSDHLTQTEEIIYTQCAHVFHSRCLNTWLDRSKSCPQCREKVTRNKTRKLYFTFSNNDTPSSTDTSTGYQGIPLQEKVDSLKFQILLKEKDIQFQSSANITLKKQNAGLKQEITKLEREISQKNAAIHALKEQIAYFKEESSQCEYLKSRIAQLKSKLGQLKPLQTLLYAPLSDVSKMIGDTKDPDVLTTYISIMKKELIESFDKCKRLKLTIKRLKEKLLANNTKSDISLEEQQQQQPVDFREGKFEAASAIIENTTPQERIGEASEASLDINNKCDNVPSPSEEKGRETEGGQIDYNSGLTEIPIEGGVVVVVPPKAKKQITTLRKNAVTKRSGERKVDKMPAAAAAHSAKNIEENMHEGIELEHKNGTLDLELVSCISSSSGSTVHVTEENDLRSRSRNDDDGINCMAPRAKKKRVHSKYNTICNTTIDLT